MFEQRWPLESFTAAQNLLMRAETHFQQNAESDQIERIIDQTKILHICLRDITINSNYQSIIEITSLTVNKDIAADVLRSILKLYIRMRYYIYCKGIIQKYKSKKIITKPKGLHTEIRRSSAGSFNNED